MKTQLKSCTAHHCKCFYIKYITLVLFVVHTVRYVRSNKTGKHPEPITASQAYR